MAVGIRIKLLGITEEQFDKGHDQINPDRKPPKGLLFHASGPVEGGWGIMDFWESRADFDVFAARIPEGFAAVGVQPQLLRTSTSSPFTRRSPPKRARLAASAGVTCRASGCRARLRICVTSSHANRPQGAFVNTRAAAQLPQRRLRKSNLPSKT